MYLKIDDDLKRLIDETSSLSGIQKDAIREVFEFLLIRWAEQVASNPNGLARLQIPFLGTIAVRYKGDTILESGEVETEVDAFFSLSDRFKKLVGDIHDEGESIVIDLLKKKIDNAILTSSSRSD